MKKEKERERESDREYEISRHICRAGVFGSRQGVASGPRQGEEKLHGKGVDREPISV